MGQRINNLPGGALTTGRALVGFLATALLVAAGGYLFFHDAIVAGLIERQTQMQYAYEDRIAALRLRLDQLASRRLLDQDSVEGKVQRLVLRQAQLETRAAVVARLVDRVTGGGETVAAPAPRVGGPPAGKAAGFADSAGARAPTRDDAAAATRSEKPQPEGLELRLGGDRTPFASEPAREAPKRDARTPMDVSSAEAAPRAGDADAPLPARLEYLARALDRVERDQYRRLSDLLLPTMAAATRLRQAFELTGLPAERLGGGGAPARQRPASAVGGPFVAAPATGAFEQRLAAAQSALERLDALRSALPRTPLRKPLSGPLQETSGFGYRPDPFLGRPALHSGVDLRDDYGAPVRATAAGVVAVAGPQGGYGNLVEIDHGGGVSTRYGHLSAIDVLPGQQVPPGVVVGRVGSTGRSTGPHLHYEVRLDGEPTDPERFLKAASVLDASPR